MIKYDSCSSKLGILKNILSNVKLNSLIKTPYNSKYCSIKYDHQTSVFKFKADIEIVETASASNAAYITSIGSPISSFNNIHTTAFSDNYHLNNIVVLFDYTKIYSIELYEKTILKYYVYNTDGSIIFDDEVIPKDDDCKMFQYLSVNMEIDLNDIIKHITDIESAIELQNRD